MGRRRRAVLVVSVALAAVVGARRLLSGERETPPAAPAPSREARASSWGEDLAPARSIAPAQRPLSRALAREPARVPPARAREAPAARAPARPAVRPVEPAPASLRGTDVDGAIVVDEHGNLVDHAQAIALFDYFLSATGEEPREVIEARIAAAVRERADGPAADQALDLLDRYLRYREAASALSIDEEAAPAAGLEALRDLRRAWFGEEDAAEIFGDEEREIEATLEEARIAADTTLSPDERDAQIARVEDALPEAVREARAAATQPLRQQAAEQALREAGASEEELHAYRVATAGPEAADRLADLDRERAAWQARVAAFNAARAQIAATISDPAARRAAEEALLERDFAPEERLRVRVILLLQ